MLTSAPASGTGSGRQTKLLKIEKIAVCRPIPSAIGAIAATANPGLRPSVRSA